MFYECFWPRYGQRCGRVAGLSILTLPYTYTYKPLIIKTSGSGSGSGASATCHITLSYNVSYIYWK